MNANEPEYIQSDVETLIIFVIVALMLVIAAIVAVDPTTGGEPSSRSWRQSEKADA
jgi:hypothetical protein